IFDSWAGELGKAEFMEFSYPYLDIMVAEVKERVCDL
ncbi:unnamed protein product, partial [marine sediment metagenome]